MLTDAFGVLSATGGSVIQILSVERSARAVGRFIGQQPRFARQDHSRWSTGCSPQFLALEATGELHESALLIIL